jgi:monoamine oxidase
VPEQRTTTGCRSQGPSGLPADEHTDTDGQGHIDGALRAGERAARELLG